MGARMAYKTFSKLQSKKQKINTFFTLRMFISRCRRNCIQKSSLVAEKEVVVQNSTIYFA